MKAKKTWILVANGSRAHVVERLGVADRFEPVPGMTFTFERHKPQDVMADAPGRSFESATPSRHGMSPTTDLADQEEDQFARLLVEALESGMGKTGVDRLCVVAPASLLGHLRKRYSHGLRAALVSEHAKDLTQVQPKALGDRLAGLLES